MAGCQQDSQPSSASMTSTVAPTTTTPPVTDAERAWAAGLPKLRERMDETFFEAEVILTQAQAARVHPDRPELRPQAGPARPNDRAAGEGRS
jgi:hypothetical protein